MSELNHQTEQERDFNFFLRFLMAIFGHERVERVFSLMYVRRSSVDNVDAMSPTHNHIEAESPPPSYHKKMICKK